MRDCFNDVDKNRKYELLKCGGYIFEFAYELYECVVFVDKTVFSSSLLPYSKSHIKQECSSSVCTVIRLINFIREEKQIGAEQFLLTSEAKVIHILFFLF